MNQTERLQRKTRSFGKLVKGWSFGDGIPITESVIGQADSWIILAATEGLQADVFPGISGEVAICLYINSPQGELHAIEIIIDPESKYTVCVERGYGFQFDTLVRGENFGEADAREMVTSWIDNVKSGRSYSKPVEVTII